MRTSLTVSVLAAELLKVRKRWLPYVVFAVMLAGVTVQIWLAGYASWRGDDAEFQDEALRAFALPWSLATLLDSGQFWGSVLVGVITASVVATEYNWGTVRQALVRGQTRSGYLTVKLAGIMIIAAVSLLIALGVGLLFSAIASTIADQPITFDVPDGPSAPEAVLMVLRAGYCIVPYGLLAFCLTVVGRSTAMGVAGTLVFIVIESILAGTLADIGGIAADVIAFLPAHNVNAVMATNRIGSGDFNAMALRNTGLAPSELPDPAVAALVLAGYSLLFLFVAYRVFQRRDLGVESGGT